ncbi:MAG: helix-hairpin-helix domain-containing protein [Eubacteriales bacterium]|nr:helix-hairpin-helix domain-containing protein [Eubacteriales bacterium]
MPVLHNKKKMPGFCKILGLLFLTLFFAACGKAREDIFREESMAVEETDSGRTETSEASVEPPTPETAQTQPDSSGSAAAPYVVHVCGAVQRPGVYELPEGSRIMDAVEAGGGFLAGADQDSCNLAEPVTDGCQIYIMTKEESSRLTETERKAGIQPSERSASNAAGGTEGLSAGGLVNLNTADLAALKTLPGIGDSRAAAILEWREKNGRFERIEDIMKVNGIKQAAFDKLKDKITV